MYFSNCNSEFPLDYRYKYNNGSFIVMSKVYSKNNQPIRRPSNNPARNDALGWKSAMTKVTNQFQTVATVGALPSEV